MEWIKLNINKLPDREVLTANFKKGSYGYREKMIGYVYKDGDKICCDGSEMLENCTHYIEIDMHDIE